MIGTMLFMMTEVACAIITRGDEILVTQRSEFMNHPLAWEFPGGKLLPGESPEKCIIREIREELNLEIRVEQLLPSVIHEYEGDKIKLIPFVCSLRSGELRLTEHKSVRWLKRSELSSVAMLEADMKVIHALTGRWK